jgi:hypothetical protein
MQVGKRAMCLSARGKEPARRLPRNSTPSPHRPRALDVKAVMDVKRFGGSSAFLARPVVEVHNFEPFLLPAGVGKFLVVW